eukprot:tig00000545_g1978.t1
MGALVDFVAAWGAVHDGDPRIASIMLGLLGFWGEWHTFPTEIAIPQRLKDRIADAYVKTLWSAGSRSFAVDVASDRACLPTGKAFPRTRLVARYPGSVPASLPLGFHDDAFVHETMEGDGDKTFLSLMRAAGAMTRWQTQQIGGEARKCPRSRGFGPRLRRRGRCINATRVSWMILAKAFEPNGFFPRSAIPRVNAASRRMGYELHVAAATYPAVFRDGAAAVVSVDVQNRGIAPFYYRWDVEVALRTAAGFVAYTWRVDWDIRVVPPSASATFAAALPPPSGLVVNPLPGGLPLRFANREMAGPWLNLGPVSCQY